MKEICKRVANLCVEANTRSGGAYGGKAFLPISVSGCHLATHVTSVWDPHPHTHGCTAQIAAIACIGALKLGRAVLLQLDRTTDMVSTPPALVLALSLYILPYAINSPPDLQKGPHS